MEDNEKCSRISSSRREEKEAEGEEENQNNETLKRRISSHPLYGLLIENHMDCLKLGSILSAESDQDEDQELHYKQDDENKASSLHNLSELDYFMEAYCFALSKLKEAMEEPQQETLAFLDAMHSQLMELTRTTDHPPPNTSSGERD